VLTHLSEDDVIPASLIAPLAEARVMVVPTPERAAKVIGHLTGHGGEARGPLPGSEESAVSRAGQLLGLNAIARLLPSDFPWAHWITVADVSQAQAAVARLGLPAAIKAAGATISHRTELGAVELVRDGDQLAGAFGRVAGICQQHGDDVVVQEGVPTGQEILLAAVRDPEYGVAAILRPGGTLAELLDEQVVLWAGWAPEDRLATLAQSRLGALARGYRQQPGGDLTTLASVVETVLAAMARSSAEFLEFNPVVMMTDGIRVLDAIGTLVPENGEPA